MVEALAEPTRWRVVELLRSGEKSVGELVDHLPVSQSAVSQHLKVLRAAGLVVDRAEGTRRLYRVDLGALSALRAWFDGFWDDALAAFADAADLEADAEDAARHHPAPPRHHPEPPRHHKETHP